MEIGTLLTDKRPILFVADATEGQCGPWVGHEGVTKIEVYQDFGEGAMVPWFAVWKGDVLAARLQATKFATVSYVE